MTLTVDPNWWQSLFDEVYLTTDARSVCDDALTRREVDVITELLPMQRSDRILDLCGGHGRHSLEMSRRGYTKCTVFDYSHVLLSEGRNNARQLGFAIEFVQGDARDIRLGASCFDHVLILGNSLGYSPDQDSDLKILGQAYRVLQPSGRLLVDVADGRAIRNTFTPIAWHEIGADIVVCRRRELSGNRICAREVVISKAQGLIRDRTYGMQLYDPDQLGDLLNRVGFSNIVLHTDFSLHTGKGDYGFMNHRMIATALKPV